MRKKSSVGTIYYYFLYRTHVILIFATENDNYINQVFMRIYEAVHKKYNKVSDAVEIIELTRIEKVLENCPRFRNWIENLIHKVRES